MKSEIKFDKKKLINIATDHSCIIIFGAGEWGKFIAGKISGIKTGQDLIFCDNNPYIQGYESDNIRILSVESAAKINDAGFIISFLKNHMGKIRSAYYQLLKYGVDRKQIHVVDTDDILETSKEESLLKTKEYITEIIKTRKGKERINRIDNVKSLVYRIRPLKDAINGPSGVMNLQEQVLGKHLGNISLEYFYKNEKRPFNPENRQANITEAVEFARKFCEDKNTIYIAHDIFSAFGLYTIGKNYTIIYHNQGALECEYENMGLQLMEEERELINYIERVAVKNAFRIYFPSKGAGEWFYKTLEGKNADKKEIKYYPPLYNTMIWHVEMEKVDGLRRLEDTVTFFGTGQLTQAKGMDRIPVFIKNLALQTDKKIRLIVAGTGPYKKQIAEDMERITKTTPNVTYFQFDQLKHSQIRYILSISDIYLMLHRISIFDIATLEAMEAGLEIILSNIPGNTDFNQENNIILVKHDNEFIDVNRIIKMKEEYGRRNRDVFYKYFSIEKFKQRYTNMINDFIESLD